MHSNYRSLDTSYIHRHNQFFTSRVVDHMNQLTSEVVLSKNANTFNNGCNKHVLLRRGSIT